MKKINKYGEDNAFGRLAFDCSKQIRNINSGMGDPCC